MSRGMDEDMKDLPRDPSSKPCLRTKVQPEVDPAPRVGPQPRSFVLVKATFGKRSIT